MSQSLNQFTRNRARKNVVVGGALILVCITLLSCVSSFMIYREGFTDTTWWMQTGLSFFAVCVVEGAFIWLVFGFTRAFSSLLERVISLVGMTFLTAVMLTNIVTHFMMVKKMELSPFQQAWLSWGAVSVFIAVLVIVLIITCADPVVRLLRQQLRVEGKQHEVILQAKGDAMESDIIQQALLARANQEAEKMALQIIGDSQPHQSFAQSRQQVGFRPPNGSGRIARNRVRSTRNTNPLSLPEDTKGKS